MIKQLIKSQMSEGLRSSLRNLLREIEIARKHRKGARRAREFSSRQHLQLHIGCGPVIKNGWVNIDISPQADVTLDVREPLPFRENSCSIVYSEHFLEHIDYPEQTFAFLKECYRVLEPGGLFSVGVPDTELPIAAYLGLTDDSIFRLAKERWHPAWCQTEMEHLNYHFRQGQQHRFAYDFKTLAKALASAGFQEIRRRDFSPALDSEDRKIGTLYVDATKPKET